MADTTLNRIPPISNFCSVCDRVEEEDGFIMKKCSVSRNAFFCSQDCQLNDWKKLKFVCSPLPIGSLAYLKPADEERFGEMEAEVQRTSEVLQRWMDASEPHRSGNSVRRAVLPEDELVKDLRFAAPYSASAYQRVPENAESYPFRLPLTLIIRLFLIHLATPSRSNSMDQVKALEEFFASCKTPSHHPMWAPRFVCRPGDLSPVEYDIIMQVIIMHRPDLLAGGNRKASELTEEEWRKNAYNKRLINLAVIAKQRYMMN